MTDETPEAAYHYRVIARAIRAIDAAGPGLTLEALAGEIGMSPAHFQRVFSRWAGVSPKRFQQYLALGHAKALLSQRHTVLDATLATGLSGTGRMHDLFLRWEAMSPGDYARGGAGLDIAWGAFDSPFGEVVAMGTDRGLCGLGFAADAGRQAAHDDLAQRWPQARFTEAPERIAPWVEAALGRRGEARVQLIGAPFQIKVWEALMQVPEGCVTTYADIARAVGRPRAARAVGTAVGRNPVSWLIPCHRVLRGSGGLGGYHWGLPTKRALLAWETARETGRAAA
jgi:AraC family transcriptional regulator of adaptative response/methylated-DNA-[protein]-cysteine methyltransferase